jgi:type VI secretion system protein ImpK
MRSYPSPDSLLLRQFREFYLQVASLKSELVNSDALPVGQGETPQASDAARARWQHLLSVLEAQALEAGRASGGFAFEVYRQCQYVMAALADEIFLNLPWEGRKYWPLLESRLFQTHSAGEVVFENIEKLLLRGDPVYLDVATIYFLALCLGFEGKFRDAEDRTALDLYRRRLFRLISRDQPRLLDGGDHLFPQTYQYTLQEGSGRELPNPRTWLAVLGSVFVLWLCLSHALWVHITADMNTLICDINPDAQGCPSVSR